jgi:hypothetical protein
MAYPNKFTKTVIEPDTETTGNIQTFPPIFFLNCHSSMLSKFQSLTINMVKLLSLTAEIILLDILFKNTSIKGSSMA